MVKFNIEVGDTHEPYKNDMQFEAVSLPFIIEFLEEKGQVHGEIIFTTFVPEYKFEDIVLSAKFVFNFQHKRHVVVRKPEHVSVEDFIKLMESI